MKMENKENSEYHYTECGLDDVYIEQLKVIVDDHGEETIAIPYVNQLHKVIAQSIVESSSTMTGKRLRFLRTEMGLTMAELGKIVHKDQQSIGRWERGENPIDANAEALIRLIVIERLKLQPSTSAEMVSELCLPRTETKPIRIDGNDPKHYRPVKEAA